jgi:hypothetical protein
MLVNEVKIYDTLKGVVGLFEDQNEKKIILDLIKKYEKKIKANDWEKKELTVLSNMEKGKLRYFINRVLCHLVTNTYNITAKSGYHIDELIDKTKIPKEIINAKVLLMRRSSWHSRSPLEEQTNSFLIEEVKRAFLEQNKDKIIINNIN